MTRTQVRMAVAILGCFGGAAWAQATFTIQSFDVSGNTLLPADAIQSAVAPFAGSAKSMEDINRAIDALRKAYDRAGYPVVQVFPPEQAVTGGVVVLRVIEGRIARITIEGREAYDEPNIRTSLPRLKEGASPNAPQVVADIVLANENPAKQVAVNFQAGVAAGDIDATVKVTEDRIEKYTVTYDNAGGAAAGFNRLNFGYQNANVSNRDHMFTLGLNTTYEHPLDSGINVVGGYRIPFYSRGLSLDLIGSYSNSKTSTNLPGGGGSLTFTGRGTYVGTRLNQTLASVGEYRHKLIYGFDYKDFSNECGTGGGTPRPCNTVTSRPISVSYVAQLATPAYQLGGNVAYAINFPGGLHGTQTHYSADTPDAATHWDVWRANGFIAVPLPEDWQFRATANVQYAGKRLINAERFGIGGAASVRGYGERAIAGDSGYSINVEAYTFDFGKALAENIKARGVFFIDHGQVRQNAQLSPVSLLSMGLGLRLNYGKDLAVKADLGVSQTPRANQNGTVIATMPARQAYGLKPARDPWGLHVSATYSF